MNNRFLLYIDILGFSQMIADDPRKVSLVYSVLDSLNVHRHHAFKTIAFSDTILVYNPRQATSSSERSYYVWYLIEFAEDLQLRLTGHEVYFRAILTTGDFSHYPRENIECFFGEALVRAHSKEKRIPSIGLFLDRRCSGFNRYFEVAQFDSEYDFVYLTRSLGYLQRHSGGRYPFRDPAIEDAAPDVPWQVRFLEGVYRNMRSHPSPDVRAKHLTAWDLYARQFPDLTRALSDNNFSLAALGGPDTWRTTAKAMETAIKEEYQASKPLHYCQRPRAKRQQRLTSR
jgi:hypothetical protein